MRGVSAFVDFGKLLYMIGFQGVLALPTLNVANITVFSRSLSFGLVGCCFSWTPMSRFVSKAGCCRLVLGLA